MPKVRAFLDFLVERFSDAPWRVLVLLISACELAPGRAVCGERVLSATEQYLLLAFFGRQLFGERPLCARSGRSGKLVFAHIVHLPANHRQPVSGGATDFDATSTIPAGLA